MISRQSPMHQNLDINQWAKPCAIQVQLSSIVMSINATYLTIQPFRRGQPLFGCYFFRCIWKIRMNFVVIESIYWIILCAAKEIVMQIVHLTRWEQRKIKLTSWLCMTVWLTTRYHIFFFLNKQLTPVPTNNKKQTANSKHWTFPDSFSIQQKRNIFFSPTCFLRAKYSIAKKSMIKASDHNVSDE